MNYDRTFCMSDKCDNMKTCDRNYFMLIGKGVIFDRPISMSCFYKKNVECEYYIEFLKTMVYLDVI